MIPRTYTCHSAVIYGICSFITHETQLNDVFFCSYNVNNMHTYSFYLHITLFLLLSTEKSHNTVSHAPSHRLKHLEAKPIHRAIVSQYSPRKEAKKKSNQTNTRCSQGCFSGSPNFYLLAQFLF